MSAPPPGSPLCGGRVVAAGLIAMVGALALALFLRVLIATTPVRVGEGRLFWGTVLIGASGLLAGLAVEAVRQLQSGSPEPDYHRRGGRGRQRR
jgi:hypothetical protein